MDFYVHYDIGLSHEVPETGVHAARCEGERVQGTETTTQTLG